MRKSLIWTGLAGSAIALAVIAALTFAWPASSLRGPFERALSAAIGLPVDVRGPIELVFEPLPGLRGEDVRIGDPGEPAIAEAGRIDLALSMAALAGGRVSADDVRIDRLSVWAKDLRPAAVRDLAVRMARRGGLHRLELSGVQLVDLAPDEVVSVDLALHASATMANVTGTLTRSQSVPIRFTAHIASRPVNQTVNGDIEIQVGDARLILRGQVDRDGSQAEGDIALDGPVDALAAALLGRPVELAGVDASGFRAAVRLNDDGLVVQALAGAIAGTPIVGAVQMREGLGGPSMTGSIETGRLDGAGLLRVLTAIDAHFTGPVDLGLSASGLTVGPFDLGLVSAAVRREPSGLVVRIADSALFDGAAAADLLMKSDRQGPRQIALDLRLNGIDVSSLLLRGMGESGLTGVLQLRAGITSSGPDIRSLLTNAQGEGVGTLLDATLADVPPLAAFDAAGGEAVGPFAASVVRADFGLRAGVMDLRAVTLTSQGRDYAGSGVVELADRTLSLSLFPVTPVDVTPDGGASIGGAARPDGFSGDGVLLQGPFLAPRVSPIATTGRSGGASSGSERPSPRAGGAAVDGPGGRAPPAPAPDPANAADDATQPLSAAAPDLPQVPSVRNLPNKGSTELRRFGQSDGSGTTVINRLRPTN